jgi:hypothetical protein
MRGIFWNSNGFKDSKKHKFVSDLTKENNLEFIAVLETGRSDFSLRSSKIYVQEEIIFGIVRAQEVDLGECYWE